MVLTNQVIAIKIINIDLCAEVYFSHDLCIVSVRIDEIGNTSVVFYFLDSGAIDVVQVAGAVANTGF